MKYLVTHAPKRGKYHLYTPMRVIDARSAAEAVRQAEQDDPTNFAPDSDYTATKAERLEECRTYLL